MEMLFTVLVAGLLLAVGVPSFNSVIRNANMNSSVNDLVAAVQFARSEAIKRRLPITLCRGDGDACGGAGGTWNGGYVVFVDDEGNATLDEGNEVLRQVAGMPGRVTVTSVPADGDMALAITYLPSGFPDGAVDADRTLLFCDDSGGNVSGRVFSVSSTGRPQVQKISGEPSCEEAT